MSNQNPELVRDIVRSCFEEGLNNVAELALILPDDPTKDLNAEILELESERKKIQKNIGARDYSEQVQALAQELLRKRDTASRGLDSQAGLVFGAIKAQFDVRSGGNTGRFVGC